jgi:hypothetical protein
MKVNQSVQTLVRFDVSISCQSGMIARPTVRETIAAQSERLPNVGCITRRSQSTIKLEVDQVGVAGKQPAIFQLFDK